MNVSDCFTRLGQPRRPALDAESLKAAFLRLAAAAHPDRVHGGTPEETAAATARYAELNAAHTRLREPAERLLHLIELESGAKPRDVQRIPPDMAALFGEMSRLCRDADQFLATRSEASSPLVKARHFAQALEWTDRLQQFLVPLHTRRAALDAELSALDAAWDAAPPVGDPARAAALPLARLEEVQRLYGYLVRWTAQAQERVARLAA